MQSSKNDLYSSVDNKTYFDVPICDKYSNISYSNTVPKVKTFNTINQQIGRRVNNGNNFYYVDSMPNIPSPSLYKENDNDYSPYYEKKKDNDTIESFSAEQGFAEGAITACFVIIFFVLIVLTYYFMNSYFKTDKTNNKPANRPVNKPANRPVNRPVNRPMNRPMNQ